MTHEAVCGFLGENSFEMMRLGRCSWEILVICGMWVLAQVNSYLQSKEQQSAKIAVIQANPDQSKHLETARMRINETWVDLVNLRSETYTQESRVPQMEFGTPEEDALRRDFTINSLFYNINTGLVEDFSGRGLEDLEKGIIRTPLAAMETFLDGGDCAHHGLSPAATTNLNRSS